MCGLQRASLGPHYWRGIRIGWRGVVAALPLLACLGGHAAAQVAERAPRPRPLDTQLWQRVDTGAFKRRMAATITVPPDSQRVARNILRDGTLRLEAPLVAITTPTTSLKLEVSVDARPGLRCTYSGCEGTIRVELIESTRPLEEIVLPSPIQIDLYGVDAVTPSRFAAEATRRLTQVQVRSRTQDATLTVRPVGLAAVDFPLPVRTLQLRASAAVTTMDAWGLEKTRLNIAPVQGLDPADTIEVLLQGTGLRVDPSTVRVSALAGAHAEIRSRGVGEAIVTARGPSWIEGADVRVRIVLPWLFLLLALLGGLIGAFGYEQKFGAPERTRGARARSVVGIGLVAALLAIGTALGLDNYGLPLPVGVVSELLGMVEACLIAFFIDFVVARFSTPKP